MTDLRSENPISLWGSSDGSRQDDGRIGGGYCIENPAEHDPICKSYGIADTGSIYDAEGYALNKWRAA